MSKHLSITILSSLLLSITSTHAFAMDQMQPPSGDPAPITTGDPIAQPANLTPQPSTPIATIPALKRIPLVVIRFNDPFLSYQQQVTDAITQARQINPDLHVELASILPDTGDAKENWHYETFTEQMNQDVLSLITKLGVPPENINMKAQKDHTIRAVELRVFVY